MVREICKFKNNLCWKCMYVCIEANGVTDFMATVCIVLG